MILPSADVAFLEDRKLHHEVHLEAGMTCVVLPGWRIPAGYDRPTADLLLRLPAGYPDLAPDMWWFDPAVLLEGGGRIEATQTTERHLGRIWQRWSRHFQPGQWRSGVDCLESFVALIREDLRQWVN